MPEEPDISPEEEAILDRNIRKRVEAKERLGAYELRSITNRILAALQSRPQGMTWAEIREMFDKKLRDTQIKKALSTLQSNVLSAKNGEPTGERWFLAAAAANDKVLQATPQGVLHS